MRELAQSVEPRFDELVISCEGVDFIDSQGSAKILELTDISGAELGLVRVKPAVLDVLRLDGVLDELGDQQIYGNVYEACADHIPQSPMS